ncbi:uncharacterized protein SPPG_03666 [Spizellomyces punctatus DAOM BR117]|uniref:Tropomyosin n=1 Tax=Spizellomyces punctatus (strain DAOM BR117) TaxID=645134 RepID=A0A0L0HL73_SPIPD|nr:uncharacterized protein SPPG_03666 [Spizellomyces punctatus DAOM BR117]KND01877.1 hypothetical protein SPPG_03666 [Spizellomyces punctatus DAOM BR117]|eukprot:XP_016609916.1 hypothetical protein SPPG_03666 [Spizellomyces punctatus DAOM BR117]
MDKIKEKLEKLRIESESHQSRAEKAEEEAKQLKEQLAKRETEVQSLNNKITLLQENLDRTEKRVEEVKLKKVEGDKEESQVETLQRKVQLLEQQIEDKGRSWREVTDKARGLELTAEQADRKAKQLEADKTELEKRLDDMTQKYNVAKQELDSTLKGLEDL